MSISMKVEKIEQSIKELSVEEQRKLLSDLPSVLQIPEKDLAFLKLAEKSFEFRDNPEDAIEVTLCQI